MIRRIQEHTPLDKAGVQAKDAKALAANKGLRTVGDLLDLVPRSYLRPNALSDFSDLVLGEPATVIARVRSAEVIPMRNRRGNRLQVVIEDERGASMHLVFFHAAYGHLKSLQVGRLGMFFGTVSAHGGTRQLAHPEYEVFDDPQESAETVAYRRSHWIPVYSQTGTVTSAKIRRTVSFLLDAADLPDPLPASVRERRGLVGRARALDLVHRPALDDPIDAGMHRLRYDEAFVLQTILAQRRRAAAAEGSTPRRARPGGLLEAFDARLPFELTAGQREVGEVLERELAGEHPMHRLLQGEVGSGKTVVALRAMLAVVDSGGQAAILAPTEVLAAQHHRSITRLLGPLGQAGMLAFDGDQAPVSTAVALLTGSQSTAARREALNDALTGRAGIVVGTHALIQKHVQFFDLGLVVVDEQHRFGVEQRDALRGKATRPPHLLVMTATPIPRTVAMTVFGDMETATLRELPAGRQPITTHVVDVGNPRWVERTWARVAEEVRAGHQVYVVCPSIGDPAEDAALTSDTSDEEEMWSEEEVPRALATVYGTAASLTADPVLAGVRIGVLHGRLPGEAKDAAMTAFGQGEIDVLVSTTVIEVGVDVPNATVMVILDADRFGMSQLHQLRGRVGRGGNHGLCLLMTAAAPDTPAGERLTAVAATTDGFELARADLRLRREGDVLGARQSGRGTSVRFLRMGSDEDEQLIVDARADATELLAADPDLSGYPDLAATVARRLDEEQAAYLERG